MRVHVRPLYFATVFFSLLNSFLGGHCTEFNQTLPHVWKEPDSKKGPKTADFQVFFNNDVAT